MPVQIDSSKLRLAGKSNAKASKANVFGHLIIAQQRQILLYPALDQV